MTVVVNTQQTAVISASGTTGTITPTGIVAGRSLVLLLADSNGASAPQTACSDTGGNTWTIPNPPNGGATGVTQTQIFVAYVHNCVAPGTITVSGGTASNRKIILLEITGLQNTPHNAAAENFTSGSTTTPTAPSVTTTVPCFAVALISRGGNASPTGISAGWTASAAGKPDVAAPILRAGWQEFAAAGATGTCVFTFALSATPGLGMIAFPVAASGTVFTQSVTGAVSFAGSATRPKAMVVRFFRTPSLGFTGGEVAHPTARRVTATFTPTGSVNHASSLLRTFTGSLIFAGGVTSATLRLRTLTAAALSFSGVRTSIKAVSKSVSGALTFSGAQTPRVVGRALLGVFTPAGSTTMRQTLARSLAAATFLPVSVISRHASRSRVFTGGLSFLGSVASASRGALVASLSFTGSVLHPTLRGRTLTSVLSATGAFSARDITRLLFGALQASGVMHTQYLPPAGPSQPGGGGFGALMDDGFFKRYQVSEKWSRVKRVKL